MDVHYRQFLQQQRILKDRVRAVVHGTSNGFYVYGRPGTAKTHTVRATLENFKVPWTYQNGHITEIGLFSLIRDNCDKIIVLDDVSVIFNKPTACQLLLAALGHPADGSRERPVIYKTANETLTVPFTGAIIAISNLPLDGQNAAVLQALRDRITCLHYNPSNEQIGALIKHLAAEGFDQVSPEEAREVADFILDECSKRSIPLSLRLFANKAIPDYRLAKDGKLETDWRDLVRSEIEQQILPLEHATKDLTVADRHEGERQLVLRLLKKHGTRAERLEAWERETNKKRATFDRRLKELKEDGRYPQEAIADTAP